MPSVEHIEIRSRFSKGLGSEGTDLPRNVRASAQTTTVEQILLMSLLFLMPLQSYIPRLGGASILFVIYGVVGLYLGIWRRKSLIKILLHPVFLAGFLFAGISGFMEFFHESGGYRESFRIGMMIMGGVFVACLCRDLKALTFALYGCLLAGILVSMILVLTVYGTLSSATATDFESASKIRKAAFDEANALEADLNTMAYFTAQGAMVALALCLGRRERNFKKFALLLIGAFCILGTFLPMSRGSIIILVVSCAAIAYSYGLLRPKIIFGVAILTLASLMVIPDVVLSRFQFSTEKQSQSGKVESRVRLMDASIKHLPEYFLTGVGMKGYYGEWGHSSDFYDQFHDKMVGPHNCFVQVTIYWGLPGLLAYLILTWNAFWYFPKFPKFDSLGLCVLGMAVSALMESLVVQTYQGKEFALVLGLIVGSSFWIWPPRALQGRTNRCQSSQKILMPTN